MLLGPVFEFELARAARRPRFYLLRFGYGFFFLAVLAAAFRGEFVGGLDASGFEAHRTSRFARDAFAQLILIQGLAVLILTPALVAGAIAREVQRKTLYALLTSDLSSAEIVVGKLAARLLHVVVIVAAGVPILVAVGSAAGFSPWAAVLSALATFSTAYFLASLSVLASTQTRSVRGALNFTFMVVMAWLILPCSISVLWPRSSWLGDRAYEVFIRPANAWVAPTTPFALWLDVQRGAVRGADDLLARVGWMVGLQAVYGTALAAVAVASLRSAFRAREGTSRRRPPLRSAKEVATAGRRRPPCGHDAMLWKELFAPRNPTFYRHLGLAITLVLAGLLVWGTLRFALPAFREVWEVGYGVAATGSARARFLLYLRIVGTGVYVVYALGVVSDAAASVAGEREKDTWISLVSTPLTGVEILRAKILGAIWGIRHTAAVLILLWLAGAAAGSIHPLAIPVALLELAAFTWFASALGIWLSLRAKDAMRAVALATLGLLALNAGSLLVTQPLRPGGPLGYLGCSPILLAASVASYADVRGVPSHAVLGVVSDARLSGFWTAGGTELALTCLAAVLAYAVGAWTLSRAACLGFDAQLDRPPVAPPSIDDELRSATPKPHVHVPERVRVRG